MTKTTVILGKLAEAKMCYPLRTEFRDIAAAAAVPGGEVAHFEKMMECERIWALTPGILSRLGLVRVDSSHVKNNLGFVASWIPFNGLFDEENELTALGSMRAYLLRWTEQHGSTIEEDEELLKSPSLLYKHALLIRLRLLEKFYFQKMLQEVEVQELALLEALKDDDGAEQYL